ncbi:hypothetical protein [Hyphococcus sp.]|jgi:hypothetical protein|uniref:hypothetical protein n=1 Tax=Hyphococcus sp. TaxID=2038636 RepID=UPI003D121690
MRFLVLLAAVIQISAPFFINPFGSNGGRLRQGEPSLIEPAGYAFSIWGLIYIGALVYAVWQVTPAGRANPVTGQAAIFALMLYVGSTLWLAAAKYGPLWATMPLIAIMTLSAAAVLIMAGRSGLVNSSPDWWFAILPFALYAGWITCATFVNIAEVAPQYGFDRFGLSREFYGVLSLGAALICAVTIFFFSKGQFPYVATVIWALTAIIAAALARDYGREIILASGFGLIIMVGCLFYTAMLRNSGT